MMILSGVHLCDEVKYAGIHDIVFPDHNDFVPYIAIDIGGSLAKVVYFTPHTSPFPFDGSLSFKDTCKPCLVNHHHHHTTNRSPSSGNHSRDSSVRESSPNGGGGRLNFIKFETEKIDDCIDFLKKLLKHQKESTSLPSSSTSPPSSSLLSSNLTRILLSTGGGAYKFHDLLIKELGVDIHKKDEMECLVRGLNFLVKNVPREVFTYKEGQPIQFEETPPENAFPYLLVNIGSGVSILKVTSEDTYERVSGSSLGGGTFWGMVSLISDGRSFEDMLQLALSGDNTQVDMLVGDIYGMDYSKIGLKSSTIASSLGKIFKQSPEERKKLNVNDIAKSLLYMISNNIGQIAYFNAKLHGLNRIYFGGYFICGHSLTMHTLSYAIDFWSKGTMRALFLKHEGYLGAVGAFLSHQEKDAVSVS